MFVKYAIIMPLLKGTTLRLKNVVLALDAKF